MALMWRGHTVDDDTAQEIMDLLTALRKRQDEAQEARMCITELQCKLRGAQETIKVYRAVFNDLGITIPRVEEEE